MVWIGWFDQGGSCLIGDVRSVWKDEADGWLVFGGSWVMTSSDGGCVRGIVWVANEGTGDTCCSSVEWVANEGIQVTCCSLVAWVANEGVGVTCCSLIAWVANEGIGVACCSPVAWVANEGWVCASGHIGLRRISTKGSMACWSLRDEKGKTMSSRLVVSRSILSSNKYSGEISPWYFHCKVLHNWSKRESTSVDEDE